VHVATTQSRQAQIENDRVRRIDFNVAERIDAVFDGNHREAFHLQHRAIERAQFGIVFHDQDAQRIDGKHYARL
jgi:hypothetical protein